MITNQTATNRTETSQAEADDVDPDVQVHGHYERRAIVTPLPHRPLR